MGNIVYGYFDRYAYFKINHVFFFLEAVWWNGNHQLCPSVGTNPHFLLCPLLTVWTQASHFTPRGLSVLISELEHINICLTELSWGWNGYSSHDPTSACGTYPAGDSSWCHGPCLPLMLLPLSLRGVSFSCPLQALSHFYLIFAVLLVVLPHLCPHKLFKFVGTSHVARDRGYLALAWLMFSLYILCLVRIFFFNTCVKLEI